MPYFTKIYYIKLPDNVLECEHMSGNVDANNSVDDVLLRPVPDLNQSSCDLNDERDLVW